MTYDIETVKKCYKFLNIIFNSGLEYHVDKKNINKFYIEYDINNDFFKDFLHDNEALFFILNEKDMKIEFEEINNIIDKLHIEFLNYKKIINDNITKITRLEEFLDIKKHEKLNEKYKKNNYIIYETTCYYPDIGYDPEELINDKFIQYAFNKNNKKLEIISCEMDMMGLVHIRFKYHKTEKIKYLDFLKDFYIFKYFISIMATLNDENICMSKNETILDTHDKIYNIDIINKSKFNFDFSLLDDDNFKSFCEKNFISIREYKHILNKAFIKIISKHNQFKLLNYDLY